MSNGSAGFNSGSDAILNIWGQNYNNIRSLDNIIYKLAHIAEMNVLNHLHYWQALNK